MGRGEANPYCNPVESPIGLGNSFNKSLFGTYWTPLSMQGTDRVLRWGARPTFLQLVVHAIDPNKPSEGRMPLLLTLLCPQALDGQPPGHPHPHRSTPPHPIHATPPHPTPLHPKWRCHLQGVSIYFFGHGLAAAAASGHGHIKLETPSNFPETPFGVGWGGD